MKLTQKLIVAVTVEFDDSTTPEGMLKHTLADIVAQAAVKAQEYIGESCYGLELKAEIKLEAP